MASSLQSVPSQEANLPAPPLGIPALVWLFFLLAICYAPILYMLVVRWATDEDMGHGFFVPAVAGYIAWQRRAELSALPIREHPLGLLVIAGAAMQAIAGTLGAEFFISRTAFLFSIIGCVLYLGAWPAIRILRFPLLLLFFMVPIPAIIYNQITFPLQIIASNLAEFAIGVLGIPVFRNGNVLELPSQTLSVVEACSGIRSLLSLTFLALVYGYLFDSKPWMKWLLFVATVPIAILANGARVTLTGLIGEVNPEYSRGLYHTFEGWVVFLIALAMLFVFHKLVNFAWRRFHKPEAIQNA